MVSMVAEAEKPTTISDIRGDSAAPIAVDLSALPEVDPAFYMLGKEVARGGMGRVVEARDLRVGRSVVLKELLHETPAYAARFEREARVTARLQHPAIIPIYEIGKWPDGSPFYAMRMVEGGTLRAALAEASTLEARLALLPSVISAAEAIAYAHSHRVIHRDLKPSNIMVGDFGETVVIDWGLAKDLSTDDDIAPDAGPFRGNADGLTMVGSVVGTPAYMPPEQAAGEAVDERSDVYSLGAILYHLLAGTAPFKADTSEQLLALVKSQPPAPIANAPPDLLSIVDKAMSRSPADRYANAGELVAELVRYRSGQLVGAHDYSRGELVRRWIRKHRLLVIAASAALVALAIAGTIALLGIIRERDRADAQSTKATATTLALYEEQGRQQLLQGEPGRALAYLSEAYKNGRDTPALRLLLAAAARPFENQRTFECAHGVSIFAVSPDERYVAIGCESTRIIELATGRLVSQFGQAPGNLAWSADGRWVGEAGNKIGVWDARDGTKRFEILGSDQRQVFLAFSEDQRYLVSLCWDGFVRVIDSASGEIRQMFHVGSPPAASQYAALGGDILSVVSLHGEVELWNVETGKREHQLTLGGDSQSIAASKDGRRFIACGDAGAKIWGRDGRVIRELPARYDAIKPCALSNDGAQAALSTSRSVKLIDVDSDRTTAEIPTEFALAISYDANDTYLSIATLYGDLVVDAATGTIADRIPALPTLTSLGRTIRNTRDSLLAIDRSALMVTRIAAPTILSSPLGERTLAFSSDGTRMASRRNDGTVTIWNVLARKPIPHAPIRQDTKQSSDTEASFDEPYGIAFSPDARLVAVVRESDLAVLDANTGGVVRRFPKPASLSYVAFSDDNQRLMESGPYAAVWDLTTGDNKLRGARDAFALTRDGKTVLAQLGKRVAIVDLETQSQTDLELVADGPYLYGSFSKDGSRVVLADHYSGNGRAHVGIWDAKTGSRISEFSASSVGPSTSGNLLVVFNNGRIEVVRVRDGAVISSSQRDVEGGTHGNYGSPSDDGSFVALPTATSDCDIVDATTGQTLVSLGYPRESARMLAHGAGESLGQLPIWNGDSIVTSSGGVSTWKLDREQRTPAQIETLLNRVTPWRIVDGKLAAARGAIHGRVTRHGASVPGARITLTSDGWGQQFTTVADSDGSYRLADIADETYSVSTNGVTKQAVLTFRAPTVVDFEIP
jgi:WD40 repeat protein